MKSISPKHLLVMAGLLASPASTHPQQAVVPAAPLVAKKADPNKDPRTKRLLEFFAKRKCPIRNLAKDFVEAADKNDLDWRLLPSISIIESSGGKAYKNNNVLGWANCEQSFPSIRFGIHHVAAKLGKSKLYGRKSTAEKLKLYNPREIYAIRVNQVMRQISPVANLTPRPVESTEIAYAN